MDRIYKTVLFLNAAFCLLKPEGKRPASAFKLPKAFLAFLVQTVKVEHIRHLQAGDTGQYKGDASDNVKQHAVYNDA